VGNIIITDTPVVVVTSKVVSFGEQAFRFTKASTKSGVRVVNLRLELVLSNQVSRV